MKNITIEEAKEMVGTEFTYVYSNGDVIQAYIKKFDPEVGLTCLTLETKSRDGWQGGGEKEEDGTWCVIGMNFPEHAIEKALERLTEIRDTGMYKNSGGWHSSPVCSFM